MAVRVFHDAVLDRLVRSPTEVEARCSMVSVYENESLIGQESGILRITGPVPDRLREPEPGSESAYDDASILELTVKDGVASLLVEWENYSTGATEVQRYTRVLGALAWEPADGATVVLA